MFKDGADIKDYLRESPFVLAPMVDHSDHPFRMLCREFGVGLCFTPMVNARLALKDENYFNKIFYTSAKD